MPKLTNALRQTYRLASLCLAMGMSVEEAAAHSRLTSDQLQGYQRDDRFKAFLEEFNHQIEGQVIERMIRRKLRIQAKAHLVAEEAIETAIGMMRDSPQDSVRWQIIKGILRQSGVDMEATAKHEELENPEDFIKKEDPKFFHRAEEARAELEAWNEDRRPQ